MQFGAHDYLSDRPAPGRGLAAIAAMISRLRDEFLSVPGRAVLLVDNGDAYQGSPVSDVVGHQAGAAHPMVQAMNALGYDAATTGNHDFTYGPEFLEAMSGSARFPIVASNISIDGAGGGDRPLPGLRRCAILKRSFAGADGATADLRIGIIGFAPPQTVEWERFAIGPGLKADPIVDAAASLVSRLRRDGADLVIALAHSGISDGPNLDRTENAVADLAGIEGIDAIVAGHIHRVFPGGHWNHLPGADPLRGTLSGTPVVMPGAFGSHLGRIDLALARTDTGWSVEGFDVRAEPAAPTAEDGTGSSTGELGRIIDQTHGATLRFIRQKVGATTIPIQSHFCLVAPSGALSIPARAMQWHAGRLSAVARSGLPVLAAVSPFRAGGFDGATGYVDIPAGPLQLRHVTELYPFPNELCALDVTGDQLRRWLETSTRIFAPITPGRRDQPLLDPSIAPYQFDVIHGLTYEIDPSRRNGRVGHIRFSDGRPLRPDDRAILLTNGYRANGGGGYTTLRETPDIACHDMQITDIIRAYVADRAFDPTPQEVWRFARIPDTSATFLSGAGAPAHLSSIKGRSILHDGPADNGFHRFVIDF